MAHELVSFHAAVKQLEDDASKLAQKASEQRRKEFRLLLQNIGEVPAQLNGLVSRYQSLGTTNVVNVM